MLALEHDTFLRRVGQVVFLSIVAALASIAVFVSYAIAVKYFLGLNHFRDPILDFFQFISVSSSSLAAQLAVVLGSVIPVVLSSVCFQRSAAGGSPEKSSALNSVGRTAIVVMLVGVAAAFAALTMLSTYSVAAGEMVGGPTARERVIAVIAGVMSYQAIYLAQLTGLKLR